MYDLATLSAREEIKELKARYFRFTDMHEYESFGDLFIEDAVIEAGQIGQPTFVAAQGRDAIVAQTKLASDGFVKIHHGHNCEIKIEGPDKASGIWSVEYLFFDKASPEPLCTRHHYVYYFEDYRKTAAGWRFARVQIINVQTVRAPE